MCTKDGQREQLMEQKHALQTGVLEIFKSAICFKMLGDGWNKGELREWRKETLQQLDFLDTGSMKGQIELSF